MIPVWGSVVAVTLMVLSNGVATAQSDFEVGGEIAGLYPGIDTTLQATVTNPQSFPIEVTSVAVQVADLSPECPGSLLRFGSIRASVVISAGATALVPVAVQMDRAAPDACQGVVWPLEFRAVAISDGGSAGLPPPTGGGAATPVTGSDVALKLSFGAALVAAGGAILVLQRGRRRSAV